MMNIINVPVSNGSIPVPRVSREQADNNRMTITEASARLFRERGIDNVSVAELMAAAGLTHGGFYGHFESKGELAGEACRWAFERSVERWEKRVAEKSDPSLARAALTDNYLSAQSRSNSGASCPAAAFAGDVARESADAPIRAAYAAGVEELLKVLARVQETDVPCSDREGALADFATMVGGLILARATEGDPISDEFLAAARRRLKSRKRSRSSGV
jgi:TetR/AcrR family transcriptional regulator, transcriptional repressor for nem operon